MTRGQPPLVEQLAEYSVTSQQRTLSRPAILSFVERCVWLIIGRFVLFQSVLYRRFHCTCTHLQWNCQIS